MANEVDGIWTDGTTSYRVVKNDAVLSASYVVIHRADGVSIGLDGSEFRDRMRLRSVLPKQDYMLQIEVLFTEDGKRYGTYRKIAEVTIERTRNAG